MQSFKIVFQQMNEHLYYKCTHLLDDLVKMQSSLNLKDLNFQLLPKQNFSFVLEMITDLSSILYKIFSSS